MEDSTAVCGRIICVNAALLCAGRKDKYVLPYVDLGTVEVPLTELQKIPTPQNSRVLRVRPRVISSTITSCTLFKAGDKKG